MRGRNMLIQHIPDMVHQIIHCEVRLIDIIEYIISLFFIFNQKSDKRCHITDIGHRLPVFAISNHQKSSRSDLTQQIIYIPPISFSKYNRRTKNIYVPLPMRIIPLLQQTFCLPLATTVVIKRVSRM